MYDELISVIVPAYNCARWLPKCLDSVLKQSYPYLEIIVVNDGSKDETGTIIDDYARLDSRVRGIHQENGGVTAARLRGVREATGDWIGFADGDDVLELQMFQHLMENAQNHGADIAHCGFSVHHPNGMVEHLHGSGILKEQDHLTGLRDLLEEAVVEPSLCTKLYRKALFRDLEEKMPRELKNNEDMLMNYFLFSKAEKAVFEDTCLYHYLIHPGSASRSKLNEHIIYDPIRVRQMILDVCDPELKEDAYRAMVRICLVSYRQLVMADRKKYANDRKRVRSLIAEHLPDMASLSLRNKLLVRMIARTPWLFELLYPLAAIILGRE